MAAQIRAAAEQLIATDEEVEAVVRRMEGCLEPVKDPASKAFVYDFWLCPDASPR